MLLIGLLLVLLAAAVITYVVVATAGMPDVRLDYGILNLDLPPLWLFLAGLLTLAVAALGFWMIGAGARAKARHAKEVRELRKQAKASDRRAERSGDATAPRDRLARGSSAPAGGGVGNGAGRTASTPGVSPATGNTTTGNTSTGSSSPGAGAYGDGPARPGTVPGPGGDTDRSRLDLDR
ncbi:hypothetical protein [Ornithinimicrobium sp. Y1694]|uniref:hypothetical protein n=1 Tax=Ornithinimicrobium sp. Y1694 TaxID=3418590 RepID=UPI003CF26C4D